MRMRNLFTAMAFVLAFSATGLLAQTPTAEETDIVLGQDAQEVIVNGQSYTAASMAANAGVITIWGRRIVSSPRPGVIIIDCVAPFTTVCVRIIPIPVPVTPAPTQP